MLIGITVASLAPEYGGPSAKAFDLASELRRLGHDVEIFGCDSRGLDGEAISLGSIRRFHGTPIPRRLGPLIRGVPKCDVLHVLGYRDPVGTVAAMVARINSVPYLLEPAGMLKPRLRSFRMKKVFDTVVGDPVARAATLAVATSHAESEEMVAAGIDRTKVRLRINGVRFAGLLPLPERGRLREQLKIAPDVSLLLSVGRIAAIKGLPHVLEAVALLPDVHWLIAGPDEGDGTLQDLRRSIHHLAVGDRVTIRTDGLWGRAKAEALADGDAFCMASANESFGTAAAEAACAGLPLAITDQCGALDCLEPASVQTFRYGDVAGIASAITWALGPVAKRLARAAAPRIRRDLSWEVVVQQQLEIYDEALRISKVTSRLGPETQALGRRIEQARPAPSPRSDA